MVKKATGYGGSESEQIESLGCGAFAPPSFVNSWL